MFDLEIRGGVAQITLNRPRRRNAVPTVSWRVLAEQILAMENVRVLILRSAVSGSFCAGADIMDLAHLAQDPAARVAFREAMRCGLNALGTFPSIALVEGDCYGAGVALAMACDIRVATPSARFAITPAKLGISYPQQDVSRLVALVGPGQAARLLLSAGIIEAVEAVRIGLADILGSEADGEALAHAIAANSPASIAELRRAIRGLSNDVAFDAAFGSSDCAEGLTAFRLRRTPNFGRLPPQVL